MWYWNNNMMGDWGYGGWIMMFFGIVVLALIIWGVVWFARTGAVGVGGGGTVVPRREPLDIARERYAKSEITREEFETIKKNL